jgi:hypothetical protein
LLSRIRRYIGAAYFPEGSECHRGSVRAECAGHRAGRGLHSRRVSDMAAPVGLRQLCVCWCAISIVSHSPPSAVFWRRGLCGFFVGISHTAGQHYGRQRGLLSRLGPGVQALPERLFKGCVRLRQLIIASVIAYVGERALVVAKALRGFDFSRLAPRTVIGRSAFSENGLLSLTLPGEADRDSGS